MIQHVNQSINGIDSQLGEPDVRVKAQVNSQVNSIECNGRPQTFGQHRAPTRGECYFGQDQTRQHAAVSWCIKGAIKQKVLLIFNSIHVAMATDALTSGWFTGSHISVSTLSLCEPSVKLIKANFF